jgi:hypothetical protein
MSELRTVEWFIPGLEYQKCEMSQLTEGDQFRMFDPDGTPVKWDEETVFIATGNPYLNEDGIWTIDCIKFDDHIKELEKE